MLVLKLPEVFHLSWRTLDDYDAPVVVEDDNVESGQRVNLGTLLFLERVN